MPDVTYPVCPYCDTRQSVEPVDLGGRRARHLFFCTSCARTFTADTAKIPPHRPHDVHGDVGGGDYDY
jgi:hypothetical protein